MSADAKLACNRLPFQTDDSCSRGDVDITVFKDLPICLPINPTEPKGGVPQTDIPVIPITPPPCACVNIDMSGTGKVENRKGVDVKTEFKSVGDCCEGNYKANVKVNIPCIPFSLDDKSKNGKKLNITTDCDLEDASGSIKLGIASADCKLTFDPQITLRLPKQKDVAVSPELNLTTNCADTATGSFGVEVRRERCKVEFVPKLRLNIPPIPSITTCQTGTVTIDPCANRTVGTLNINPTYDNCGRLKHFCPDLKLDLACPVSGIGRDSWNDPDHPPIKIGANVSMADPCDNCFPAKKPLSIPHCNCKNFVGKRETEAEREKFPTCCAYHCRRYVPRASALRECKGKWDCGCCANFVHYWKPIPWPACFCDEEVIVERDPDSCCKLSVPKIQKTIRLGVPCPVALPTTVRAKAKLEWLTEKTIASSYAQSASMPLLWNNSSSCICDLETYTASSVGDSYPALKLGLPCPIERLKIKNRPLKIHSVVNIVNNPKDEVLTMLQATDSCSVVTPDIPLQLVVPCFTLRSGGNNVHISQGPNCTYKISVDDMPCFDTITDITFSRTTGRYYATLTYKNTCTGATRTSEVTLFYTTDHNNCT